MQDFDEKLKKGIINKVRQERLKTRKVGIKNEGLDSFSQRCLDPEDPKCTPDEFFKEISYIIDLNDLYKIVGTCYYNDEMQYCPVQLEMRVEKVRQNFKNNKYLLQIWNLSSQKVYEQPLKSNSFLIVNLLDTLKNWAICFQYFLMVYDREDQDNDCLHIMDLGSNNQKMIVRGLGHIAFLAYKNEKLFALTRNEVRFATLPSSNFGSGNPIEITSDRIRIVKPGCPLHGILMNGFSVDDNCLIVAFETPDNQLDFNMLYSYNDDDASQFDYKWEQYRIINPRKNHQIDPIKKVCYIFYQGFSFCVSLRSSGMIDIYWNMARRDSPKGVKIIDIAMSIHAFYFKLEDGSYQYFKHEGKSNLTYSMTERISEEDVDWDNIELRRIQTIVKPYTSFRLVSKFETFLIVGHGKYVSVFNIEQWKWINHLYFEEDEVLDILERIDYYHYLTVILKNGSYYSNFENEFETRQEPFTVSNRDSQINGTIEKICLDKKNNNKYTISIYDNGEYKLRGYKNSTIDEINVKNSSTYYQKNMVFVQTPNDISEVYVIYQNGSNPILYQVVDTYSFTLKRIREFNEIYVGQVHSAISFDIKDHVFIFDQTSLYIGRIDRKLEAHTFQNIYAIGVVFFTKQVSYCLCQDVAITDNAGLRLLDMESTLRKKKCKMLLLKNINFGYQGNFEYSKKTGRLAFQQSLTSIIISPLLHQNANKLLGADENDYYLLEKKTQDRLITLTNAGQLTTWNLVTGKHICTYTKTDLDLNNYSTLSKNGNVCIQYHNESVTDVKDEEFFVPWQLQTYATKQVTYMKRCDHYYRKYRIIEIKSESEVGTIMEFKFPYFTQGTNLFINENRDRLILKIINFRTFLYNIIRPYGPTPTNEVHFELVRQIVDYPDELENDLTVQQLLTFFSPCFSRYMKIDKKTKEFLIKDAISDEIVTYIPKNYMSVLDEDQAERPSQIINRIKWLDYSTLLIVNEEGNEKILNIDHGFKELSYNFRPLFNEISGEEYLNYHYYYQRSSLPQEDVLHRLQRMYQSYKSDYYLHKKKGFADFYETMLSVDKQNSYYMEHSFTFLHWSLIDQILQKKVKVKNLDETVLQQLIYNILPGGNTVLHLLVAREKELINIFRRSHEEEKIKYHVPFLPNIIGESPIHKCLEYSKFKSIDTIFSFLKYYPPDHHSRAIKDKYGDFVKHNLPGFLDYIDSRFQETEQLKKFNKGCLKEDVPGVITSELWFKDQEFAKTVMDKAALETRIKCEFIDFPGVYHYLDDDFQNFFDELAITEQLDYFNTKVIQKLIDFNYPLVRTFIISFLFLPFCCFHILFVVYANAVYEHRDESQSYRRANLGIIIVLLVFCAYFMLNELRQLFREGLDYIISVWNYIDLVAPVGVTFTLILQLIEYRGHDIDDNMLTCVFAVTTLFMWMKLLYFLRIFKSTGYLIRLLVEVVTDMGIFLLVLLITLTAFGDCLLRLSEANTSDNKFILHSPPLDPDIDPVTGEETIPEAKDLFFFSIAYTYRMILGDFDTSAFGRVSTPLVWIIWTLHMLFNMIVMLNLLISIIGDTYERVVDSQVQAGYQEFACLIAENQHLIPSYFKKKYAEKGKYLVTIQNLEDLNEDESKDPVIQRLDAMKIEVESIKTFVEKQHEKIEKIFAKVDRAYPEPIENEEVEYD